MKRILVLIFTLTLFVVAFSGFKTAEKRAIEIRDCFLTSEGANFKVMPGIHYQQGNVSLRVTVNSGGEEVAEGFKKIELLKIPQEGIVFSVPLSRRLRNHNNYRVAVGVDSIECGSQQLEWAALRVRGTSSSDFFDKKFKPINEPSDLRNQLSAAAIRKNLH